MIQHRYEARVPVPPATVAAVLSARPPSWLRRFLRLATVSLAGQPEAGRRQWYRLGPIVESDGEVVSARFRWAPHLGPALFDRFDGHFLVEPAGDGSVLVLEGVATGASGASDRQVLGELVQSLGDAIAASSGTG